MCPSSPKDVLDADATRHTLQNYLVAWNLTQYCLAYYFSGQPLSNGLHSTVGGACTKPVWNASSGLSGAGLLSFAGVKGLGMEEANAILAPQLAKGLAMSLGATNG